MTAAKKKNEKKEAKLTEALYEAVRSPVITEKATMGSQYNQITFRVPLTADKVMIRRAVETVFKVKVVKVNTSIQLGKTKSNNTVAIVMIEATIPEFGAREGQTIDVVHRHLRKLPGIPG